MSKTALVTGAGQGLGLSFTKELLSRGYFVAALEFKVSDELRALECDNLQIIECDVSSPESVANAGKVMKAESLNLIINNAGIWLDRKRRRLLDPEFEFETMIKQYEVNALGVVRICREFMPKILASDGKKTVINLSSEAGSIGEGWRKGEFGYCMSKAAQNMATKMMHNDFAEQGVKLYAIHPGWMPTPQGCAGAEEGTWPEQHPDDSARVLVDMAEGEPREGLYYDIEGKEWEW